MISSHHIQLYLKFRADGEVDLTRARVCQLSSKEKVRDKSITDVNKVWVQWMTMELNCAKVNLDMHRFRMKEIL